MEDEQLVDHKAESRTVLADKNKRPKYIALWLWSIFLSITARDSLKGKETNSKDLWTFSRKLF